MLILPVLASVVAILAAFLLFSSTSRVVHYDDGLGRSQTPEPAQPTATKANGTAATADTCKQASSFADVRDRYAFCCVSFLEMKW